MVDSAAPGAAADDGLLGRVIAGKFRIESFVGRGAMGAVYRATQLTLKKRIAIKVMNADKRDGTYASRFKREAKAASRMDHPNLLRVIDFGEEPDGLLYIAMELLEGRNLLQVLRTDFPLGAPRIVGIVSQTLAALAVAHEMGVVHRDLKPENIMLLPAKDDDGSAIEVVKVCDFGIAKILHDPAALDAGPDELSEPGRTATQTGTLTAYGTLIGTPEYMSPEQARGEPADRRSDLYSVGVILFLMLTGRLPFDAKSKIRLVLKHVEELPPRPSQFDARVEPALEEVCMKALEKRPENRFQTAREMRAALRGVFDPSVHTSAPPSRGPRAGQATPPAPHVTGPSAGSSPPARPPSVPAASRERGAARELFVTPTATLQDPHETAQAVAEARKRLSAGPASLSPPTPLPFVRDTGEGWLARARADRARLAWALGALVIAAFALYAWLR